MSYSWAMDATQITIALGTIVVFGVCAQWLGRRTGIPSIVLLLVAGIIAGPITGLVDPEELLGNTLDPAITLAVGLLLFDSGFSLEFKNLVDGRWVMYLLVSVGMLITWLVGAIGAHLIFGLDTGVALLLSAVLVVSGPTVVGPILKASRPKKSVWQILEWEGAILDPIGATLGIVVLTVLVSDAGILTGIGLTVVTAVTGIAVGLVCAALVIVAVRNFAMPDDLQVPVALMFAVLAFTVANVLLSEAGLFATLTMGLVLANQDIAYVARIRRFQASIGTLVIGILFIMLAATIDLGQLRDVLLPSVLLLAVLVLIGRPLSAFASTVGSSLSMRERVFIASVGPRGIVAASTVSFYAITLSENGMPTDDIVPITFAVIIGAGLVYGFGSPLMAKALKVGTGTPKGVALFFDQGDVHPLATELGDAGVSVLVVDEKERTQLIAEDLSYRLFGNGVEDAGLETALEDADVGTGVIGTGLRERDLVAMFIVGSDIGAANVYMLPTSAKTEATGVEARWRQRTPDKRIPFCPTITRARLAELLHGSGDLTWLPVRTAESDIAPGTVPLFIVDPDGRATIADQEIIRAAVRRGHDDSRVLCVVPKEP